MSDDRSNQATGTVSIDFLKMIHGGLVFSADMAARLGEVLCEAHYGKEEVERQKPLVAEDKGTWWRVEGSYNRERKIEGKASFFLSIEKDEGRIVEIGLWYALPTHPLASQFIDEMKRGKKGD